MYTRPVIAHFQNPQNNGILSNANACGQVGSLRQGNICTIYLQYEGEIIRKCSFQASGCPNLIAAASVLTTLVQGRCKEEVLSLPRTALEAALGWQPGENAGCSEMALHALTTAILTPNCAPPGAS